MKRLGTGCYTESAGDAGGRKCEHADKEYERGHGLLVAVVVETDHIMSDCAIRGRTPCCTEKERADARVRTAQQKSQGDLEFGLKVYMSAV